MRPDSNPRLIIHKDTKPNAFQRHLYWEYTWYQSFMKELRKYLRQLDCHIIYWGYGEEGFNDPENLKIYGNIYDNHTYGEIIVHFRYHYHAYALEFRPSSKHGLIILLYNIDYLYNDKKRLANFRLFTEHDKLFEELVKEVQFYFHLPSILLFPFILQKLDDLMSSIISIQSYSIFL